MGINLEYVTLLGEINKAGQLPVGGTVLELGAQDISAEPVAIAAHAKQCGFSVSASSFPTARELYHSLGFTGYQCIDASSDHGALVLDLNTIIDSSILHERFDIVTNLGTIEHCFNILSLFSNMHNFCKKSGLMIHAFPSNCNTNHGLFVMQPRLFDEVATANDYEILLFCFTVDYRPTIYAYSYENYRLFDDRDLMCYVVMQKKNAITFRTPFDSMFSEINDLEMYRRATAPREDMFPYIKGEWRNVRPKGTTNVPTRLASPQLHRKYVKRLIDILGNM